MKKQVNNFLMDDMKKYIPNLNSDDYEIITGYGSAEVIKYVRNYYDWHLPVDITAWIRVNDPDENLVYRNLYNEYFFVANTIVYILFPIYNEWKDNQPMVCSAYWINSFKIPLVKITLNEFGIDLFFAYSYSKWVVTINSKQFLIDFVDRDLFVTDSEDASNNSFVGRYLYASHEENHSNLFIVLDDNNNLEKFIKYFKTCLESKK